MRKRVNVEPTLGPIYTLRVPITGKIVNHEMSVGDILNCIYARAKVDEVLPSGELVRLNLTNYNKDNTIKKEVKDEQTTVTEIKVPVEESITPEPIKPLEDSKEEIKVEEKKEEVIEGEPTKEEEKVEPPKMNNNKNNGKRK